MTRRVLYSSPFIPPEWIAAHGLGPVRAIPPCRSAGEGVCPIAAGFGGRLRAGGELAILATTCDQMRRLADTLPAGDRIFVMNVPATWNNSASRRLYREELERMGRFLVGAGGVAPSVEAVASVMKAFDEDRAERGCCDGRGLRFPAAAPVETHASADNPGVPPRQPAVALVGGPLRDEDAWIALAIEDAGGFIALDATETGERVRPARFDVDAARRDPLEELTRAYFDTIPDAFRRPLSMLQGYLLREFDRRRISAVVLIRALWCDQWHAQLAWLRQSCGRPVIEIDQGGQDQDLARTRTRLEALLEVAR